MRDYDVRVALRNHLAEEHGSDPSTRIVEELGLCEAARVDIAVINGSLTGFELKSERDTLARLPNQAEIYNRVFDYVHLVVAEKHVTHALDAIPDWWGVTTALAAATPLGVTLRADRKGGRNPSVDASAIVQLLWRDEALAILERLEADRGVRTKPRSAIWDRLVETAALDVLRDEVRSSLKARRGWRESPGPRGNASTSPPSGTTPRFLARRFR